MILKTLEDAVFVLDEQINWQCIGLESTLTDITYSSVFETQLYGKKQELAKMGLSEYSFVCGYAAFGSAVVKFD